MLTFWPLIFYGMGVIVGAGIYVALESVIQRAGTLAPFSFLLAGISAGLTGLCYADLAGRIPQAAGAAAYVAHGFRSRALGLLTGLATIASIAVATAAIAHGASGFLASVVPVPTTLIAVVLVIGFTALAASGARASVGLAAIVGALEIAGLVVAMASGLLNAPALPVSGLWPTSLAELDGALAGAFIAFFAFIGFESLANMSEDTKNAGRTVPMAILGAVFGSVLLYVGVAFAAIAGGRGDGNPLLGMFAGKSALTFAALAFVAVSNGVLVEILMLSRLLFGMAKNGQAPERLARVDPRGRAPVAATACAGAIALAATLLLPFQKLLVFANAITLCLFLAVDLALLLIQWREPLSAGKFAAPRWAPPLAALVSLALLAAELTG